MEEFQKLDQFSPSFLGRKSTFGYRFHFEGKNDALISQVRHVKADFYYVVAITGKRNNVNLLKVA